MQELEVREKLRGWMAKHSKKPLPAQFDDRTPVLELGILSSLDIVEFVLYIESLRGTDIDPDGIEASAFTNIDSVYAAFFAAN